MPGTLNDSVMALEAGIDAGNWTEVDVLNEIYGGALNDPHGIGRLLYQRYLTQYKDTLINEGYVIQESSLHAFCHEWLFAGSWRSWREGP